MADEPLKAPYVNFYPSDWRGGTAHLSPTLEWTYFQICLHNWDKGKAMGRTLMPMMLSRNPDWERDVAALVEMDKIGLTAKGAAFVPRAIMTHRAAVAALEKKSAAGRKGAQNRWNNNAQHSDDGKNGDLIFSVPLEIWRDFKEHRRKLRAPMTERAERAILKKLEAIKAEHGHDPLAVLEQSIIKGWRDVFPLKGEANGQRYREGGSTLFDGWGD